MTGGMAYLYDPEGRAADLMNHETLVTCPVTVAHWEEQLLALVTRHACGDLAAVKAAAILQALGRGKGQLCAGLPKGNADPS